MQTIILLTLVVIAGFLFKKEKSTYARMVIGSVFGVAFFSIWPFTVYYIEIHELNKNHLIYAYTIIFILAITLSFLLTKIRQELAIAITALIFFLSTTVFTMSFDSEIKNKISIYTGYFKNNYSAKDNINNTHDLSQGQGQSQSQRKTTSAHNYILTLHNDWQKKTDKGSLFEYYLLFQGTNNIAEFRPKCFNTETISLPEIVKNIKHSIQPNGLKIKRNCYQKNNAIYACRISILDNKKQIKRMRWYSLSTNTHHGIELDFVLFNNEHSTLNEIDKVINSAKITNKTNKSTNCLGLTEWM